MDRYKSGLFTHVADADQRRFKSCFSAANDPAGLGDTEAAADIGDLLYALIFCHDNYLVNAVRALQRFKRMGNDRSPAYRRQDLIPAHAL